MKDLASLIGFIVKGALVLAALYGCCLLFFWGIVAISSLFG